MSKSTDLKHFLKGSLINAGRFLARFWGLNHVVVSRIKRTYVDFVYVNLCKFSKRESMVSSIGGFAYNCREIIVEIIKKN